MYKCSDGLYNRTAMSYAITHRTWFSCITLALIHSLYTNRLFTVRVNRFFFFSFSFSFSFFSLVVSFYSFTVCRNLCTVLHAFFFTKFKLSTGFNDISLPFCLLYSVQRTSVPIMLCHSPIQLWQCHTQYKEEEEEEEKTIHRNSHTNPIQTKPNPITYQEYYEIFGEVLAIDLLRNDIPLVSGMLMSDEMTKFFVLGNLNIKLLVWLVVIVCFDTMLTVFLARRTTNCYQTKQLSLKWTRQQQNEKK